MISHVVPIPVGRDGVLLQNGRLGQVLGGFRLSGVFSARSGDPITVTGVRTASNQGQGFTNRPDVTGPVSILGGQGRGQLWFDTGVFTDPVQGMVGNSGRGIIRGPGYVNYNLTLARLFMIDERVRLNFMASAFNLTNTTPFGDPSGSFTSGSFGQITSFSGERQLRIGLHLGF